MIYVVLFEDDPSAPADVRARLMPDHLAFLDANAGAVRAAGPLSGPDGAAGGLWLVEAASCDAVDALVTADPFWPTGLRKSVRVLEWRQVFADGVRLV